jgi:hypothetical protein
MIKKGHDLSRIVDTLHSLPKHKRLAALGELLKDKNVSIQSSQRHHVRCPLKDQATPHLETEFV